MLSEDENEIVLISIYGVDQPGVTSQITGILGKYNAEILDIGQADIHQSLSLGILVRFRKSQTNVGGGVLKDILFKGYELGVKVRFVPISTEQYNEWVSKQGQDRHIVTILGKGITA